MNKQIIHVHLTPNAKLDKIIQIQPTEFKIYTTAIPENNKANKAMIKILSKFFKIPQNAFIIKQGGKSRNKTIEIKADNNKSL